MGAIYKRELKSYFNNMIGFVIVAVIALFLGLFYVVYNVVQGYPYFAYAVVPVVSYFMILMPILTMRSFADERKAKTDQLLLTAPVSVAKVVMGKFLAMLSVFAIPVLVSCIYPLIISTKDYHSFVIDYSTIFAFVLLGAAYIAIGMFLSSLTESSIIAAISSFAVYFLLMIMNNLTSYIPANSLANAIGFCIIIVVLAILVSKMTKNIYAAVIFAVVMMAGVWILYFVKSDIFYTGIANVLNAIPFSATLSNFRDGIFDVSALVEYLSVTIFFIFLTTQSIQKRRWN